MVSNWSNIPHCAHRYENTGHNTGLSRCGWIQNRVPAFPRAPKGPYSIQYMVIPGNCAARFANSKSPEPVVRPKYSAAVPPRRRVRACPGRPCRTSTVCPAGAALCRRASRARRSTCRREGRPPGRLREPHDEAHPQPPRQPPGVVDLVLVVAEHHKLPDQLGTGGAVLLLVGVDTAIVVDGAVELSLPAVERIGGPTGAVDGAVERRRRCLTSDSSGKPQSPTPFCSIPQTTSNLTPPRPGGSLLRSRRMSTRTSCLSWACGPGMSLEAGSTGSDDLRGGRGSSLHVDGCDEDGCRWNCCCDPARQRRLAGRRARQVSHLRCPRALEQSSEHQLEGPAHGESRRRRRHCGSSHGCQRCAHLGHHADTDRQRKARLPDPGRPG